MSRVVVKNPSIGRRDGSGRHPHRKQLRMLHFLNRSSLISISNMSEAAKSSFRSSFRDVGVSINEYAETQLVTPGRLYICACLDDATDEDNEFLRNDTKFKTIVDTDRKHGQSLNTIPIVGGTTSSISMTKFLGITRYRVNLTSKSYVNNIMAQISVWTKW